MVETLKPSPFSVILDVDGVEFLCLPKTRRAAIAEKALLDGGTYAFCQRQERFDTDAACGAEY
jgi:hypothetical protein